MIMNMILFGLGCFIVGVVFSPIIVKLLKLCLRQLGKDTDRLVDKHK